MIPRRGLLAGLGALLAAPAIIRTPGLLMPVREVCFGWPVHDVLNDGYIHVHGVCTDLSIIAPSAWNDIFAGSVGPRYPEKPRMVASATTRALCRRLLRAEMEWAFPGASRSVTLAG